MTDKLAVWNTSQGSYVPVEKVSAMPLWHLYPAQMKPGTEQSDDIERLRVAGVLFMAAYNAARAAKSVSSWNAVGMARNIYARLYEEVNGTYGSFNHFWQVEYDIRHRSGSK